MSAAPSLRDRPGWRSVGVVVLCALAGGGLRRALHDGKPSVPAAAAPADIRRTDMPSPSHAPLTAASLQSLSALQRLRSLASRLPDMSVDDITPLVQSLAASRSDDWRIRPDKINDAMLQALFIRWAELDATGMIAALRGESYRFSFGVRQFAVNAWTERSGLQAVKSIAPQWPALAEQAVWEMLARHPDQLDTLLPWMGLPPNFNSIQEDEGFCQRLGPERLARIAAAMGDQGRAIETLTGFEDDNRAREVALTFPQGRIRDEALLRLRLSGSNVAEFRAVFESLPRGRARDGFAGFYAAALEAAHPGTGLEWARAQTSGITRAEAIAGIACYAGTDPFANLPDVSSAAKPDTSSAPADPFAEPLGPPPPLPLPLPLGAECAKTMELYVEAWKAWPLERYDPPEPRINDLLTGTLRSWRKVEPQAADAWLQSLDNPALRELLSEFVPDDPDSRAPSGNPVDSDAWDKGKALATRLIDPEDSDAARKEWAATSAEDRNRLSPLMMSYLIENHDPQKALAFFEDLAPRERTLSVWYDAASAKLALNLAEASQWVNALPAGPQRDTAATALVERLSATEPEHTPVFLPDVNYRPYADRDPAAAFVWASSMSGAAERIRCMTLAARAWALADADAARAAVTSAETLPENVRQSLLQQLPKGGSQ